MERHILGDINIDINPSSKNLSSFARYYTTMLLRNGAISLVTIPTRLTDKTATIIYHIATNDFKHQESLKFVIAPYLDILIDFAFSNGIFLNSCKTAKVIPLKSGNVKWLPEDSPHGRFATEDWPQRRFATQQVSRSVVQPNSPDPNSPNPPNPNPFDPTLLTQPQPITVLW